LESPFGGIPLKNGLMVLMLEIGMAVGVRISGILSLVEGQAKPGTGFGTHTEIRAKARSESRVSAYQAGLFGLEVGI
jgi:hypothetical protein